MSYFIYKLRFKQFFLNNDGIKSFGNRCINKYVSKAAVEKANLTTTYVTVLKEERNKRQQEFLECENADRMDDGSFVLRRKKAKRMKLVVYVTILFEIFLNYISTLIFIQGEGLLFIAVRWGLSIILALAAMLVTDGLLTRLLPEDSVRVKGAGSGKEDDETYRRNTSIKRTIGLILLPILLVAVEIAIAGVARARALDIEGGQAGGMLYYGFILLSMALPVIAGYFKWDSEHHGKLYQNTVNYYKAQKLLHVLNLIIAANMKDVKAVVETSVRKAWQVFSKFKLYKENYNKNKEIIENIASNHYTYSAENFREEALSHFGAEVKDILAELENLQGQKYKTTIYARKQISQMDPQN